ncbi:uncharacterized protein LOC111695111 isoform X2 [Eurytemora carolleeae]|uniref:uncharacterized protein LOC111695111 isoform X2 n=1 Tax=Eurytemora carolleeae TaxID=1294199 RepID=UPI000C77D830|nr:uncharacterized protein LOC111695111 isoform X2 [Eurytemora carolleeae]|eukprot:XP_023320069.1 uncharacterized protein LOC111695111 isoform X2 [Eurytemora affinis]
MVFNMKVNLPEDTRTLEFYTRQSDSRCLHLEAVDLNSLIHLLPFKEKVKLKQDSAAYIQCPICKLSGPLLKDGIILKFLEDFKVSAVEIDEKGEAFPVDQEKCDDSIIDLTESFNSSCCLEELEEGEIKSPVKLKNGSSWLKSRSSYQLNSEPKKLTKIISAPNLAAKTVESVLKERSLNIATLLKANQSKSKVKRLGSTSRTLKAPPSNVRFFKVTTECPHKHDN